MDGLVSLGRSTRPLLSDEQIPVDGVQQAAAKTLSSGFFLLLNDDDDVSRHLFEGIRGMRDAVCASECDPTVHRTSLLLLRWR